VFGLGPATRVYLAVGATDLRKGFEGLFGLVKDRLGLEPLSGHVVCFFATDPEVGSSCYSGTALAFGVAENAWKGAVSNGRWSAMVR
jgi:hypothetical protein